MSGGSAGAAAALLSTCRVSIRQHTLVALGCLDAKRPASLHVDGEVLASELGLAVGLRNHANRSRTRCCSGCCVFCVSICTFVQVKQVN